MVTRLERAKQRDWSAAKDHKTMAGLLFGHVDSLRQNDLSSYRREVLRRMRLYAGGLSVNGTDYTGAAGRARFNLIRSVVDTGASIMAASRTLPYVQTRGADWKKRRIAARRTRVIQTQFAQVGVFDKTLAVITDALVTGLGGLKFFEDSDSDGGTTSCERVLPLSIVWDPASTVTCEPRELFQILPVNRQVLCEMFPRVSEDAIYKASGPSAVDHLDFQMTKLGGVDQAMVVECWRLPSSSQADDGLHVICCNGVMLLKEKWKLTRFPFAFLRGWVPNQLGFPGCSIVELCEEAQLRIEELADFVAECQRLGSRPMGFLPDGDGVEPEQIDNTAMALYRVKGQQPPTFFTFEATPNDLQAQYAMIREETLSMLGFSVQNVQGEKPEGVNSGAGLKALEDISSKRHVVMLRHLERYYQDCATAMCDTNDMVAENRPEFEVDVSTRANWLDTSKWKEVGFKPGEATMAVLPVSALVGSVSAQHDTLADWVQQGWCDARTAKELAGHPDVEGQAEDDDEHSEYAHWLLDRVLDGERVALDPHMSLEVFMSICQPEYLRAKRLKAPESVLDEMRRLMNQAKAMMQAANAAMAPPPVPPAPAAPQGADPLSLPGGSGGMMPV
jgi:hypothetical protein